MYIRKYQLEALPRPVVLDPTPLLLLFGQPKADVQSGLPADAASLRETGSVDRYTPRGPVSHRIV